jgi:hypothetical protein
MYPPARANEQLLRLLLYSTIRSVSVYLARVRSPCTKCHERHGFKSICPTYRATQASPCGSHEHANDQVTSTRRRTVTDRTSIEWESGTHCIRSERT